MSLLNRDSGVLKKPEGDGGRTVPNHSIHKLGKSAIISKRILLVNALIP